MSSIRNRDGAARTMWSRIRGAVRRSVRSEGNTSQSSALGSVGGPGACLAGQRCCRSSSLPLACWVLLGVLVALMFASTFAGLLQVWNQDPNYSHGFLVPLGSAVMAWFAARRLGNRGVAPQGGELARGAFRILAGVLLHLAAWFLGVLLLDVLALVCVLQGILLCLGGQSWLRTFRVPVFFLVFMAPLPMAWYQPLALYLQQLVSVLSGWALNALGILAYQEGNLIQLSGQALEVGEACNGLRQLTGVLALAVAVGYLSHRSAWFAWALALLAVPIAIVANCARVVLTAGIIRAWGAPWAAGTLHVVEGLVAVGCAVIGTLAAARALAWVEDRLLRRPADGRRDNGTQRHHAGASPPVSLEGTVAASPPGRPGFALAVVTLAVALAGQGIVYAHVSSAGPRAAGNLSQPLSALPLKLAGWSGEDVPIDDARLRYADQHLQRVYRDPTGRSAVRLWMTFSREGLDRGHHPEVCMAVAGQPEDLRGREAVAMGDGGAPIQRFRYGRPGRYQWVYYWYYTLPSPADPGLSQIQRVYQQLSCRPASVTIQVFAPDRAAEDAAVSRDFVNLVDASLQPLLGSGAKRDSRRIPVMVIDGPEPVN